MTVDEVKEYLNQVRNSDKLIDLKQKRLDELNINGIRVYKEIGKPDIHLEFIWIDDGDLPNDYIG